MSPAAPKASRTNPAPSADKAGESSPKKSSRYYRFGICGGPSSGKTCILTALGMPRIPHPQRLSATLNPPPRLGYPALKAGTAWIEEQKVRLASGDVPEQNPNIDQRLVLRYKFIDHAQNEHFVELEDYSGELMNARSATAELAEKLRARLVQMDGLLIVAQHPRPGARANEHAPELHSLRGAFARLREDQLDRSETHIVPMALLVNKWDRTGALDLSAPSQPVAPQLTRGDREALAERKASMSVEQAKLLDFLTAEPRPPHTTLLDELESASDRHCVAYPVSAFGEALSEIDPATGANIEKPSNPHELPSFGLEDPFIWLIQQRIALDVERLEKLAETPMLPLRPLATARCKNEAARILHRIKRTDEQAARPEAVLRRAAKLQNLQNLAFACFLILSVLTGEALVDAFGHRRARYALENPADQEGWKAGNAWYLDYASAKAWRHLGYGLLFPRGKADEERHDKLTEEDEHSWNALIAATDKSPGDRPGRATRHVAEHQDANNYLCKHGELAKNLVSDQDFDQRMQKAADLLAGFEGRHKSLLAQFNLVKGNPDPDCSAMLQAGKDLDAQIQACQQEIDALTDKQEAGLSARRSAVRAQLLGLLADITIVVDKNILRRKYRRAMEELDVTEAGRLLVDEMTTSDFDPQRKEFQDIAAGVLHKKVKEEIGGTGQYWEAGLTRLTNFERNQRIMALNATVFGEEIRTLSAEVLQLGDSYLYSRVLRGGGISEANLYLEKAPLRVMNRTGVVTAYRDYLVACNSVRQYRVRVAQIVWPGSLATDSFGKMVTLLNNDTPQSPVYLSDEAGSTPWTEPSGSNSLVMDISCKATEVPRLGIRIRATNALWLRKDLGEGRVDSAIESWLGDGEPVRLTGGNWPGSLVKLKAQINDGHGGWSDFTKPVLPQWSAQ